MLTDPQATFRCVCGGAVAGWSELNTVAKCATCDRPEYHLLKCALTASGDAREWVIAARGVTASNRDSFEAQGFHVLEPFSGARFFPDIPRIVGEMTNADGSLKQA